MRRDRSQWFPGDEPPPDGEIEGPARRGVGRPRKHKPPEPNITSIDLGTVAAARRVAEEIIGGEVNGEALDRMAGDLAEAWGSRMSAEGLFRMRAEARGGRPRSPDAVLVFDCREILALHGLKATIGGDTDGAERSKAVQLADALLRAITEKNRRVSPRQIRGARRISRGKRT